MQNHNARYFDVKHCCSCLGVASLPLFFWPETERESVMSRRKATILCIGDRWNDLIGRKVLLEQNGYSVLQATSSHEGIQLFLSQSVDAVVLEYLMPGMRGDLVAAKMKSINAQVPILLLSPYQPLPKQKLQSVDGFLPEIQPARTLLRMVQQLLDTSPKPFFHRWLDHWRVRNQTTHTLKASDF